MGSKASKQKEEQSKSGFVPAPSANLPKRETVLKKKLDTAVKTGVLNLADLV